ncbi:MAG: DUF2252 family protein [Pseudolabrys sp.]|nr:DUF2252 family protein [Pseudolabrys sp.]
MGIVAANRKYETWLTAQLKNEIVKPDLRRKREKMRDSAFSFLRATYWRWAENILEICPDAATAPAVLAVGDIHLENYGTWRDREGRVVWGVNDYDEAAEMPYVLDIIRLATSAVLAGRRNQISLKEITTSILTGYQRGIDSPRAFILDRNHLRMRNQFVVNEEARAKFWQKMDLQHQEALKKKSKPKAPWRKIFADSLPERIPLVYWPRIAGTGSLGRPRWVAYGTWRNGPILREAKALVPSGWIKAHGGPTQFKLIQAAGGPHRSPDPWYNVEGSLLVRRLSPNNHKINLDAQPGLLNPDILRAMGRDLAAAHLSEPGRRHAVLRDLRTRKSRWFREGVEKAAKAVSGEYAEWMNSAR